MADYALEGPKWGVPSYGTGGGVVTWAVDSTISSFFLADIVNAFAEWSRNANITFQQVSSTATAQIDFTQGFIDGQNNTLGTATYSFRGAQMLSAVIKVDSAEGWRSTGGDVVSATGVDFYMVALHEIGHAIGLDHYNGTTAAMNAFLPRSISSLQPSDIHGIQALYGAPGISVVYRFFDTRNSTHFYTADGAEYGALRQNGSFQFEGAAWSTPQASASTLDVYRFYDKRNGDHFYTTDVNERNALITFYAADMTFEGVAFQAFKTAAAPGALVLERFYNTITGAHHFSSNATETAGIKAGGAGPGWIDEGPGLIVHVPTAVVPSTEMLV